MEELLCDQLASCTVEERAAFYRVRTTLREVPILRSGKIESVFAVGGRGRQVLIFEDVEQGFEWCQPDSDGVIHSFGCSQAGLQARLHELAQNDRT